MSRVFLFLSCGGFRGPCVIQAIMLIYGTAVFCALPSSFVFAESGDHQKNVLMIVIDDLKAITANHTRQKDHFLRLVYPDATVRSDVQNRLTPNLDRLAKQSVEFTRAICASPVCNSSRAATLTGIPPASSGLSGNFDGVFFRDWEWNGFKPLSNSTTLPEYLKQNGWYTACTGKVFHSENVAEHADFPRSWNLWTQVNGAAGPTQFTRWSAAVHNQYFGRLHHWGQEGDDSQTYEKTADFRRAEFVANALQHGRARNRNKRLAFPDDRPFFLACGIFRPHAPYVVTKDLIDLFPAEEMSVNRDLMNHFIKDCEDLSAAGLKTTSVARQGERLVYNDQPFAMRLKAGMEAGITAGIADGDIELWRDMIRHYLASVALADRCVGRILDGLCAGRFHDNTVVILWSDHGYNLGEKLHEAKYRMWDDANNSVLMIHDPRSPHRHGEVHSEPVSLLDIFPTVLTLADLPSPDTRQSGVDLTPILQNQYAARGKPVSGVWSARNPNIRDAFIMTTRYRLIRFRENDEQVELYQIDEDPDERTNLAGRPEHATTIRDLLEQLNRVLPKVSSD